MARFSFPLLFLLSLLLQQQQHAGAASSPSSATAAAVSAALVMPPTNLMVESVARPEGVDVASPRLSWELEAADAGARGLVQYAYQVGVTVGAETVWASGVVASGATTVAIPVGLPPSARVDWGVRVWADAQGPPTAFANASFTTGLAAWDGGWVCGAGLTENLFRASFSPGVPLAEVASALVHVAGLGVHEVRFNGAPAGGDALRKLDGGWTSYRHRVLYTTHDLTAALAPGENVLGIALGNSWFGDAGWYKQPPYGWPTATNGGGFSFAGAAPLLRLQLVLRLTNGSQWRLAAGPSTVVATRGPVLFDSLYDGETFDGRRAAELAGWDAPGYVPAAPGDWQPVVPAADNATVNPALQAQLTAQPFEPTMRLSSAAPLTMWSPAPGLTVYDFGENGVGNVRWTFRDLPAGTNVTMRYAEVLQHPPYGPADGSLYFDNLRNAHATDHYMASGAGGIEVYEPRFTWHGFRYAQVSGLPAAPALDDVAVVRQGNGAAPGASASFAAPLLGRIEAMAVNTMRGSLQGGPGSCGQRDERQFFTGDTQVAARTMMQHFRLRALMASWVLTGLDDQLADGDIGYYVPRPLAEDNSGSPQWSTGFVTAAWELMRLEGDTAGCRAVYAGVQRWIDFNEAQYNASLARCGNLSCYWPQWPAEWQQIGPDPDSSCVNAFAYVHDLQMAADIADGLGQAADAAAYRARATARTREYHAAFFRPQASTYGAGTQSELAMALWLGAPPTPAAESAVFASLLQAVAAAGGKEQTGIVGQRFLFDVLAARGRADVGVRMLLDDTYPSFGFMAQGADNPEPSATVWELWAAHTGDPIMSSRNHLMFVSYATFLLRVCCGVEPLGPGYADGALVWPVGLGLANASTQAQLPWAAGSMATPRGTIAVAWSTALPPAPAPATCGENHEAPAPGYNYVSVGCAQPNATIDSIIFADFGTPTGTCTGGGPFARNPACSAANGTAIVAAACLGRRNCSVAADIRVFGDPCPGTPKQLAINVTCSQAPAPPALGFLGSLSVDVPVNLPATVRLPTFGLAAADLVVTEGSSPPLSSDPRVFADGLFVPGVPGVTGAALSPLPLGAQVIDIAVGSGSFRFAVWHI